jgi:hypothetical protein
MNLSRRTRAHAVHARLRDLVVYGLADLDFGATGIALQLLQKCSCFVDSKG